MLLLPEARHPAVGVNYGIFHGGVIIDPLRSLNNFIETYEIMFGN